MLLVKGFTYWGKKGRGYLELLAQVLPAGRLKHIVEACMGSGTFSANISGGYSEIKKTAIELDKGVCALAECIIHRPFELLEKIENTEYSEEVCLSSIQLLQEVKNGKEVDALELAQAEYAALYMSRNSQRMVARKQDSFKKHTDEKQAKKSKRNLERQKHNFYRDAPSVVWECNKGWQGLNIINEDFMKYPEYWFEGKNTLVFADVPYLYSGRGIEGRKNNNTGYIYDWIDEKHYEFLEFVTQDIPEGKEQSKIIICSNFEIDSEGNLFRRDKKNGRIEMKDDIYCQKLLPAGFRMVIIQNKFSSEAEKKSQKKKNKVEVVFLNYFDILGDWNKLKYFDYCDVYGE